MRPYSRWRVLKNNVTHQLLSDITNVPFCSSPSHLTFHSCLNRGCFMSCKCLFLYNRCPCCLSPSGLAPHLWTLDCLRLSYFCRLPPMGYLVQCLVLWGHAWIKCVLKYGYTEDKGQPICVHLINLTYVNRIHLCAPLYVVIIASSLALLVLCMSDTEQIVLHAVSQHSDVWIGQHWH